MSTLIGLIAVVLTGFIALPSQAVAWNIPGHMLSGSIAFQILRRESAYTVEAVKTILESHPWYANHWQAQLEKQVTSIERDEMLFMLATRWAGDIRTRDKSTAPWAVALHRLAVQARRAAR